MTALAGMAAAATVADPGVTVLVVEDDDGDALLVTELLHIGLPVARVLRARDLAEAHDALAAGVDCVLLDLGLPDASGTDAVDQLLQGRPEVAIVVVTGADDERIGVSAVATGAQDYLVKDQLDERVLTRSVLYAIERRRAEESTRRLYEAERQRADNARMERALLPNPVLASTGTTLAVAYRPGNRGATLGGDFYDAVELSSGLLRVVIGDVSGHGPDEAALGATLRSAWRALVLAELPTDEVLGTIDRVLRTERLQPSSFVTLCMLDIDASHRHADVTLAGHPAPFLLPLDQPLDDPGAGASGGPGGRAAPGAADAAVGAGPVGERCRGPLLGVLADPTWRAERIELPPRWALLLYTDGLVEGRARPGAADRLGEAEALRIAVDQQQGGARGSTLIDALVAEVGRRHGGPLADDVAVCLVEGGWR